MTDDTSARKQSGATYPLESAASVTADVWTQQVVDVAAALAVDLERGLTSDECTDRLARYGPNELDAAPPEPLWRRVWRQFTDPLVVVLFAAIVISVLAWMTDGSEGLPLEAIVIAVIVVANAAVGTWQEGRAIRAVDALRRMGGTHSTVRRDGRTQVVASPELVPGDVVLLGQGDAVGADVRLVESASLAIAEAALTGESAPVAKSVEPLSAVTPLAERTNMAYQGTAVALGRGVGVVVATGMGSEIGRIAQLIEGAGQDKTPLQRQIDWLGRLLGVIVLALACVVVATIVLTSDVSTFAELVEALLVGVSLAVAAVPEGLPAILTVVLAMGVQRMASGNAIVKHLSSVETLGCASVICSDKTGTLTLNQMSIVTIVVPSGELDVVRDGGALDDLSDSAPGCAANDIAAEAALVVRAGCIANDASTQQDASGAVVLHGDPTEAAFLVVERLLGDRDDRDEAFRRIGEIPFDSDRKLMTTINEHSAAIGFGGHDSDLMMFTKGAPDVLIDRCEFERIGDAIRPLTAERRAVVVAQVDDLADRALRTLAVAYRPVDEVVADWSTTETNLTFLGVVGIIDPPRPEARTAVQEAHNGGIRVIMITGDHPRTAARIAAELDVVESGGRVVTGAEIADMDDDELADITAEVNVFARVDPEHKLRLVRALQRNGQVTAMTGDGVNDAPALKQADIGVAMGLNGTEVSKEAADMILADDNFATILRAVREGREIFADIRKFLRYMLASNTGEVLVVLLGVLFASALGLSGGSDGLAVPLLATQILWINLVTDGALALALGVDPAVENVMDRPPRSLGERVVDRQMGMMIGLIGSVTALVSLAALDLGLPGGLIGGSGDLATARTMAFTTLVLAQVFNAFTARSATVSVFVDVFSNRLLWAAAGATVLAQVAVVYLPGLSAAFDTESLTFEEWLICAGLSSVVLIAGEIAKMVARYRRRRRTGTFGSGRVGLRSPG